MRLLIMEFKDFVLNFKKMCENSDCGHCSVDEYLNKHNHSSSLSCHDIYCLLDSNIEPIVEKWAEEHPIRTYESDFVEKLDELLKLFPNHELKGFVEGNKIKFYDLICVADFYFAGDTSKVKYDCLNDSDSCKACWKREIKQEK